MNWHPQYLTKKYGWHRIVPEAERTEGYQPELLLVLVHGFQGECRKTWGDVPEFVRNRVRAELHDPRFDCDILSFDYPSQLWHGANYRTAATQLRALLTGRSFDRYRHLVFVVHSTGGLIVKRLLLEDHEALASLERGARLGAGVLNCSMLRTRRIVNIGVPHRGSSWLFLILITLFSPLLLPIMTLLGLFGWLWAALERKPELRTGFCTLLFQLTWGYRYLIQLEQRYVEFVRTLDKNDCPRPISIERVGSRDYAIASDLPDEFRPDQKGSGAYSDRAARPRPSHNQFGAGFVLPGTHSSVKVPENENDPLVGLIAHEVSAFGRWLVAAVPDQGMYLFTLVDQEFGVGPLVPASPVPVGYSPDPRRTIEGSWLGSQTDVFDELRHRLGSQTDAPDESRHRASDGPTTAYLVTGGTGVGKSAVLRRLAARTAVDYWRLPGMAPYPLVIPFYLFQLRKEDPARLENGTSFWELVAEWWCDWANEQLRNRSQWTLGPVAPPLTLQWLHDRFEETTTVGSLVLIIDGVDDFLIRQTLVDVSHIRNLFGALRDRYKSAKFRVVYGVRSSLGITGLVDDNKILELARLNSKQAVVLAELLDVDPTTPDELARLLGEEVGAEARALLLTPLVLSKLLPQFHSIPKSELTTRAGVLQRTLRSNIEQSRVALAGVDPDRRSGGPTTDECLDAITLVGHAFYTNYWASVTFDALFLAVNQLRESWEDHLKHNRNAPRLADAVAGFQLVRHSERLRALLQRTTFFDNNGVIRVEHREWEEFLAARYLRYAVQFEYINGLFGRGAVTRMYFLIGDMLATVPDVRFRAEFFEAVCREAEQRLGGGDITALNPPGHVYGIVGHARAPLDAAACDAMLAPLRKFPRMVEIVGLQTLGFRAANTKATDPSRDLLARKLVEEFKATESGGASRHSQPYLYLVAWCHARRLARNLGQQFDAPHPFSHFAMIEAGGGGIAGLLGEALLSDAADTVSHIEDKRRVTNRIESNLQRIFLELQQEVHERPSKLIPAVTYLVTIVAAHHYGCPSPEVQQGLPWLLRRGESADRAQVESADRARAEVEEYSPIEEPELPAIWHACRTIFNLPAGVSRTAPAPYPPHSEGGCPVIDFKTPSVVANPAPIYAGLHRSGPVHEFKAMNGWLVVKYEDVRALLHKAPSKDGQPPGPDGELSSGGRRYRKGIDHFTEEERREHAPLSEELGETLGQMMLFHDALEHIRLRKHLMRPFTRTALIGFRDAVEKTARSLVDKFPRGPFDFVETFAYQLPTGVICELMDIPPEDREILIRWADNLTYFFSAMPPSMNQLVKASEDTHEMTAYFRKLCSSRQNSMASDLLTRLAKYVHDDKEPFTPEEAAAQCVLLLMAGQETTRGLLALGCRTLLQNPEALHALDKDRGLVENAVEELLRFEAPIQFISREVTAPVTVGEQLIPKEQLVFLMLGAANRDPVMFPDPDRFDIRRPNANKHLAFGSGLHYCLGAELARLEMVVALEVLLPRLLEMRPAGEPEWTPNLAFRGLKKFPVEWIPVSDGPSG